jgi:hypothetical protein
MITYHELKKKQRQAKREELKEIEAKLHPCPVINGFDILHQHKGQKIIFSAWKGDEPLNRKTAEWSRDYVYFSQNFYAEERPYLEWLTAQE